MYIKLECELKLRLTWHHVLPGSVPVLAAEARYPAGDEDHEADGDAADDEEQLEVDLAVAAGEPVAALAADVAAPADDALTVAVAEVALRLGR